MTLPVTIFSIFFVLFGVVRLQKESIYGIRNISQNHGVGKTRDFSSVRKSSINSLRYSDDDPNNCKQCIWLGDQEKPLYNLAYIVACFPASTSCLKGENEMKNVVFRQIESGPCITATIKCTNTTSFCSFIYVSQPDGTTPIDSITSSTLVLECVNQKWRYKEKTIEAVGCGALCGGGAWPNTTTSTTTPTTTTVTTTTPEPTTTTTITTTPEPTTTTTTLTTTTETTTTPEPTTTTTPTTTTETTTTPEPTTTTTIPTTTTETTTTTEPTTTTTIPTTTTETPTTTPTTTTETTTTPEPTTTTTEPITTSTESTTPCVTTEPPTTPAPTTTRANRGCHVAGTK